LRVAFVYIRDLLVYVNRDFSKGAFCPPENGFAPLDYASMIKLISIYCV